MIGNNFCFKLHVQIFRFMDSVYVRTTPRGVTVSSVRTFTTTCPGDQPDKTPQMPVKVRAHYVYYMYSKLTWDHFSFPVIY